jgi:ubiquinone/menaquinone biosynthesis C-methylase UbiE
MSVASHLGINLAEYDRRIRSFIPDYEAMLNVASAAVPRGARLIVDLGTGTGALAERCLRQAPQARVVGIDLDEGMMVMASRRLGSRATLVRGSFLRADLPRCDAVVASLALHHVRTRTAKAALYRRIRRALRPGGRLVVVDCQPSGSPELAGGQRDAWRSHLERTYSARKASGYFRAWANEDVYVPIDREVELMTRAGFRAEVLWRRGAFAVLVGL